MHYEAMTRYLEMQHYSTSGKLLKCSDVNAKDLTTHFLNKAIEENNKYVN